MQIELLELPEYRVAYTRFLGAPWLCEPAWVTIGQWAMEQKLFTPEALYIGLNHDDPSITPMDKCRYDACIVLKDHYKMIETSEVKEGKVPAGLHAVVKTKIKNSEVLECFKTLFFWTQSNNYKIVGTPYEFYPDASQMTNDPEIPYPIWVCVPVEKI